MKPQNPLKLISISLIFLLCNWSQDSNVSGDRKQKVNFFGEIETKNDTKYKIDNISVGRIYKQIPLFEIQKNPQGNTAITTDPRKGIITRYDLAEIATIEVPYPDQILTFQKKAGGPKTEYIELSIALNDKTHTKTSCLIDLRRKLYCDKISDAGPIEMEVPFTSLKRLTIKGYRYKDPENEKETVQNIKNKI